jgi:hypothetical protein
LFHSRFAFRFGTPERVTAPSALEPHANGVPLILIPASQLAIFFSYTKNCERASEKHCYSAAKCGAIFFMVSTLFEVFHFDKNNLFREKFEI